MGTEWLTGRSTLGSGEFLAWRERAVAQVAQPNWPVFDREAWRGTAVPSVLATPFRLAQGDGVDLSKIEPVPELPCHITLVNGRVRDHGELPPGVILGDWQDLSPAEREHLGRGLPADGFTALNQAAVPGITVVRVMGNPISPLHLIHQSQAGEAPVLACPRWVVILAPGASLTLVEEYVSTGTCWTNGVVEIHLGQGSQLQHYIVQRESLQSVHLLRLGVEQAQDSHYTLRTVSAGARWSRCEPVICQAGTGTFTQLRGLSLVGGRQHSDMHSVITHDHPQGTSRQVHKCVVAHQGQAVFHGLVRVAPVAQLTDAGQLNQNLLLSKQAKVDTRPQLAIQADNVKCTHGATVSDLDPATLFYLQSRGIDPSAARSLVVAGFAEELLREIPFPTLRQCCHLWMQKLTQSQPTEATP
ncbi:FeS assembly protein SufD [Gloeomargarita lithophora Alchichica-D10]|uniref:FeS assembly protein SufD n=1 Tax=Gloeomargarita lithophora Alchichica-D10 TaxID=1188229 RepID=A0A1J0AC95_9CYAN|nr:Fe-S cluster assembly protein SufD [Gloeomargarita lithophora]APB33546.1 FeS assembly protein SufD [Gloeomargarita lithophora Alchichica-D10]